MAKRQAFRIVDLSGGLNPDSNPVLIADNEAAEVRNIRFDRLGSLVSRRGYGRYLDENSGSNILAIGRWLPQGSTTGGKVLAHTADGHLRRVAASYPSEFSGLSTTVGGQFLSIQDETFYYNGADTPVIYDGTSAREAGIVAPASAPTLGTSLGGTVHATVVYAYTYYDSVTGVESNPSPSASITPGSPSTVDLTALPGTHPRADKIRVYRTDIGNPTGPLYRLVELPIATVSYADTGAITPNPLLPLLYDNDPPGTFEHMAFIKGYAFGSIGNTLYWSKPYDFEHWPALNSTEVPFEGNDVIRALAAFQDTLVVFGRRNIVLVAGSLGQWALSRTDVDSGIVSGSAFAEIDGSLVYLDYDGLKALPGNQRVAPKLDRIFAGTAPADIEKAAVLYVPEERAIWVSFPNGTYTVHLPNRAISWYDFGSPSWVSKGIDGLSFPLFIDQASSRYVNTYGAVNDLGADISILWRSKIFQLTNPELVKFFRRIGAFASIGSAGVVTVTISDSGRSVAVPLNATSDAEGAEWDFADWDDPTSVYAAEGLQYFIAPLPAQTLFGHTMQVTVTADVPDRTEVVSPITFEFREANRFLG